jgi:hypothetical protein
MWEMVEVKVPGFWIFIKGDQSIHIARTEGCTLFVRGPSAERKRHEFADEDALQLFQISIAEQLAERGWTLFGVNRDRRVGERRAQRRDTPDRRAAISASGSP